MSGVKSAEESRQEYGKKKEEVYALLERTVDYYRAEGEEAKEKAFEKLAQDLEDGEFSIVVVGEFSAGKSTLLNALMRERILPSFTNETTATVNFLRHSEKAKNGESGRVYFQDGTQKVLENVTLETIDQYVSTKGDEVAHKIKHLDLYLDSDFLKDGVTLVDSPGLNGLSEGHREITEMQILQSHASIFVFNSDHPGSKTDFEFLYDLQKKVKTIILVLNKIDGIKKDEGETVESVIETLKSNYRKQFPGQKEVPEIWPVAAYPALVARNREPMEYHGKKVWSEDEKAKLEETSRMTAFEDRLLQFLTCGEKTHRQLLEPVNRIISVISETRASYEEEIKLLQLRPDSDEVENQIDDMKKMIAAMEDQEEERKNAISEQAETALKEVVEDLKAKFEGLRTRKLNEIDSFEDIDSLLDYLDTFEDQFLKTIVRYSRDEDILLRDKILLIVKSQYGRAAREIEQSLEEKNHVIHVELEDHLEKETGIYEVGLKEMQEKEKCYEEELKKLKEEEKRQGENYFNSRQIERKKENLENKIKDLKESRDFVRAQPLPQINRYTQEKPEEEKRHGLLGAIAWIFVGNKKVTRHVSVEDSTQYDDAKKAQDVQSEELKQEIDALTRELYHIDDVDSGADEMNWLRVKEEVSEAREALTRVIDDNTKTIEKKHKAYILKIKHKLRNYCDNAIEELCSQIKKSLRECQNDYVQLIYAALESSIRQEIQEEQERLERLQKQLQDSEENRNGRIAELKDKMDRINLILNDAVNQQVELENMEVAELKYTAL